MAGLDNSTCLELALEGERLCKCGDFRSGVAFFEASIQAGTDDLKTLSAIYSQLGNAYFFLGDYPKAVNYHKHDLTLARTMGDKLGEAKASGNLGNTLKVMGKFDEAILCCKRHLDITTQLDDRVGRARALYNLANAYHAKGKHVGRLGQQDPGEFPDEVKSCLAKALEYYEMNMELTQTLGDRSGEGRASGNLGNVHYLMGNFEEAILFHEKRLDIAKEFGDKNAQRRAYTNLGNAHVFSGNFEIAAQHYKKSLVLSQELGDRAVEAQACYSLGNTYTLLRDYTKAIEYHLRHLSIAQLLNDKVGEGRAYWSLGNAHSAMGEHKRALHYAKHHLVVSKELGDAMGQATAQMNVSDLRRVLAIPDDQEDSPVETEEEVFEETGKEGKSGLGGKKPTGVSNRRRSMEEMKLIRMTPDAKTILGETGRRVPPPVMEGNEDEKEGTSTNRQQRSYSVGTVLFHNKEGATGLNRSLLNTSRTSEAEDEEEEDQDAFFDMLTRVQADRLDDQRCVMPREKISDNGQRFAGPVAGCSKGSGGGSMASVTSESSGCSKPPLVSKGSFHHTNKENVMTKEKKALPTRANSLPAPGFSKHKHHHHHNTDKSAGGDDLLDMIWGMQSKRMDEQRASLPEPCSPDDEFFDMLMRCQGSRLEDQRSELPDSGMGHQRGLTVPDEDFFSLIARLQDKRMDDQRADIKDKNRNTLNN